MFSLAAFEEHKLRAQAFIKKGVSKTHYFFAGAE